MGITAREPPEPFEHYGLKVDPKILSIPARVIAQPTLDFASGQPGEVIKKYKDQKNVQKEYAMRGQWQLATDVKFLDGNRTPSGRPFFLIPRKFQYAAVPGFLKSFW
jgi:hypothetical protein